MKRILILFALAISSVHCISQETTTVTVAGVEFYPAYDIEEVVDIFIFNPPYEALIDLGEEMYVMLFKQTPVGYKHAIDQVIKVLEKNNISFENDRVEESILLPPGCDRFDNYHCMVTPMSIGDAEVEILWETKEGIRIGLSCSEEAFRMFLIKSGNRQKQEERINSLMRGEFKPAEDNEKQRIERERQEQPERLNNLGRDAFGRQGVGETEGEEGITQGSGNQGDPNGSPDSDNFSTGGGLDNNSFSYGLGSRRARGSWPLPNTSGCDVTHKIEITVEIQVDRDGNVVNTAVSKATYTDKCIWVMVVEAALKSKFSPDQDAAYRQVGWIKYIIVP